MAGKFPPVWMDELRARSDLVQVVSGYVSLKKNGKRYWGLCPFHGEKTASFSVDSEAQLYYCFGCKAGGNVITFIEEMEHLSFPEAVALLADRAHMPMPEMINDEDYERRKAQRERLLDANREAAKFFYETLFTPAGAAALDYLHGRGLNDAAIRKFGLGAAPDRWDALLKHLTGMGFTEHELALADLIRIREAEPASENGPARPARTYDVFRNRVMFPIINQYGNVIAFSGRILEKKGQQKYVNTSDTPVFNKGKNIFGANLLKRERHLDRIILVEGNLDVVSLTQFGIRGVCATLGTALTPEQAQLLKRFAPVIYLAYDGDAAGQKAILKGLDTFGSAGIPCRVLDFPAGMDPDEFIRAEGVEGFNALPVLTPETYRIRRMKEDSDLSTQEGRVDFARKAVAVIAGLDPVERDGHLRELTVQTGFSREVLDAQIREELDRRKKKNEDPWAGRDAARSKRVDPLVAMGVEKPEAATAADAAKKKPPTEAEWGIQRAEEVLIGLAATGRLPGDLIREEDFTDPELKLLYQELRDGRSAAALVDEAPDGESRSRRTRLLLSPPAESTDELIAMAQECVTSIRRNGYKKKMKEIEAQMANSSGEEQMRLLAEYQALTETLQKM